MTRPCLVLTIALAVWLAGGAARPVTSEPRLLLWVWEKETDLRRRDTARVAVAYLAGSLLLRGDELAMQRRVSDGGSSWFTRS